VTQVAVRFDTARLKQDLARDKARLARTLRRVVNAAAYQALDDVRADMTKVFDRPTPFVQRGLYVIPARDGDSFDGTVAQLDWRQFGAAVTAQKVLRAQMEGGARNLKRFERAIGLPASRVAVPAKWAPLDQYGNIPGPFIVQMLSALRLFGEQGYRANRAEGAKLRRGQSEFFIVRPFSEHGQLSPGIYRVAQEMGGAPLMVVAFVRRANYRARFFPDRVARASVAQNIQGLWQQGLARTLPFRR
jgi:hypothetical protein